MALFPKICNSYRCRRAVHSTFILFLIGALCATIAAIATNHKRQERAEFAYLNAIATDSKETFLKSNSIKESLLKRPNICGSIALYSNSGELTNLYPTPLKNELEGQKRIEKMALSKLRRGKTENVIDANSNDEILIYSTLPDSRIIEFDIERDRLNNALGGGRGEFILIIILIFLVFIIITSLIYRNLTKPLDMLSTNLSKLKSREKISYQESEQGNDVAKFIYQYNILISEIEKQHSYMASVEKERSWNKMMKMVAHEIKNPLTPMVLQAQMVERKIIKQNQLDKEEILSLLRTIVSQGARISNLVNKMAESKNTFVAEENRVNIEHFFNQISELFSGFTNISISSKLKLDKRDDFNVIINHEMLYTVITNIVHNAIDAIKEGNSLKGVIKIWATLSPTELVVAIYNNGVLIESEKLPKIFDFKQTTKKNGNGIGLFTVDMMVKIANGTIKAESSKERGTIFTVKLPIH